MSWGDSVLMAGCVVLRGLGCTDGVALYSGGNVALGDMGSGVWVLCWDVGVGISCVCGLCRINSSVLMSGCVVLIGLGCDEGIVVW